MGSSEDTIPKGEIVPGLRAHASPRGLGSSFHLLLDRNANPMLPDLFFFKPNRIVDFQGNFLKNIVS